MREIRFKGFHEKISKSDSSKLIRYFYYFFQFFLGRKAYGFEIKKQFVDGFERELASNVQVTFYQQEARKEYKQLTI